MSSRMILKAPRNQEEVQQKYEEGFEQLKRYYMFMYEDEYRLYFKHIGTRDYVAIRKGK